MLANFQKEIAISEERRKDAVEQQEKLQEQLTKVIDENGVEQQRLKFEMEKANREKD